MRIARPEPAETRTIPDNEASWNGETIDYFDIPDEAGPGDLCFPTFADLPVAREIGGETVIFHTRGNSTKIQDMGFIDGHPVGLYQLPSGTFQSDDGRYAIRGGTVLGICRFAHYLILGTWEVVFRGIFTYNYNGTTFRVSVQGTTGSGWAWYDSGTGFSNGVAPGWGIALSTYLGNGQCTGGWDIWVDGIEKCRNGVPVNQT